MNLKAVTLATLLASCVPAYSGELVENDHYELPEYSSPAVHVVCMELENLTSLLDTLAVQIQIYATTGQHPEGCSVFHPQPLILPAHELFSLYVADDNRLFGVIKAEYEEGKFFWTYIDGNILVIPNSDT